MCPFTGQRRGISSTWEHSRGVITHTSRAVQTETEGVSGKKLCGLHLWTPYTRKRSSTEKGTAVRLIDPADQNSIATETETQAHESVEVQTIPEPTKEPVPTKEGFKT